MRVWLTLIALGVSVASTHALGGALRAIETTPGGPPPQVQPAPQRQPDSQPQPQESSPPAKPSGPKSRLRQVAPDLDPDVTTIYRGKLGDALIQMRIAAKPDEPGSYSGDYFAYGGGQNVLVSGEIDEETFFLEESDDGRRISGSWEGKMIVEASRGYIVGVWKNADESETRPFRLERVLRTRSAVKRST
ncbi:MAG TPA: hypothetical protein VFS42_01705 [Burkholderiaceae bacterium]|nr:hypothetical protein [Burkholderiaceae bacterium]